MSFCHSERTLNMRNLRHHLLMEEDRKLSQEKERNSNNYELHLGEERYNGNKRNWQKRKPKGDLRDKLNKKRGHDDHENYDSSQGVTRTKRTSLVTTVVYMGISELTAGRRRNLMIKRSRTIIKMILKATLRGKVCITFSYALNLYLLPLF